MIAIIGSTRYREEMEDYRKKLISSGIDKEVEMPMFDGFPEADELMIAEHNRDMIERADEVHLFWDGRSVGTILDLGMTMALRKPLKIVLLEKMKIENVFIKYAERREYLQTAIV